MTTLATVKLIYDYHYWRIGRVLNSCEILTSQQWDQSFTPSWGSVHALLAHMVASELIWLGRWNGVSAPALMPAAEVPAFKDIRSKWALIELEVRDFIEQCDDARLAKDVTYTNTKGITHTLQLGALMMHVVDHATHHRGELVAMLTMLDVPHPEDGMLGYLIEQSAK